MSNINVPCCFYPTTVVLVDDNQKYLNSLHLELDVLRSSSKLYVDPSSALRFLRDEYKPNPFITRCIVEPEDDYAERYTLDINVHAIRNEVYNKKRFSEISVIVVDCIMPGMNGLELCEQLKDKPFKKILLTGEAQEQKAIEGFNQGIINKFIRKDDLDFGHTINTAIQDLQYQFFLDLTKTIINEAFSVGETHYLECLDDPVFINFFKQICEKNNIVEFYLLDKQGSFLLIDMQGKSSWLIIKSEEELEALCAFAKDSDESEAIVRRLEAGNEIPYFHTDSDLETPPSKWEKYMHPAKKLSGKQTYYYALVSNTDAFHESHESSEKIFSYEKYLETL